MDRHERNKTHTMYVQLQRADLCLELCLQQWATVREVASLHGHDHGIRDSVCSTYIR